MTQILAFDWLVDVMEAVTAGPAAGDARDAFPHFLDSQSQIIATQLCALPALSQSCNR